MPIVCVKNIRAAPCVSVPDFLSNVAERLHDTRKFCDRQPLSQGAFAQLRLASHFD